MLICWIGDEGSEIIGGVGRGIRSGDCGTRGGMVGARVRIGAMNVPGRRRHSVADSECGSRLQGGRRAVKVFGESDMKRGNHAR